MTWVEARLEPGAVPADVYHWTDQRPKSFHHFWDEPWWPGAYVVRVLDTQANLEECPAINHLALWDERPDKQFYGETWAAWAFSFFQAGSMLATKGDERERIKLVHCYLNAQGLSVADEFWFALRFAWNRLTIVPRIRWREWRS